MLRKGRGWGSQGSALETAVPVHGNHSLLASEEHSFCKCVKWSSQGNNLLDTDDSQFSDSRLAKIFFLLSP